MERFDIERHQITWQLLARLVRKCLCNQGLRVKLCRSSPEQINDNHQSLQSIINSAVRDSILDTAEINSKPHLLLLFLQLHISAEHKYGKEIY
jgi:hypothetical protein